MLPVAVTSLVEPAVAPEPELPSLPSEAVRVVRVIELIELIVFEAEFEFEPEPEPSSEHATVRADIKDRRHALRFISW
jgi:hypothetical protein